MVSSAASSAAKPRLPNGMPVLGRFRRGELKYLANVNVLTTGFDAPHIDCVALVRPTMSPGLYYQMVGRGFRLHPGKQNCIAEGQRVLTDRGLVPIERVTAAMRVWDGHAFVQHGGVMCQGEQEVICYAGLVATSDHKVWTKEGWKAFGECAVEQTAICVTGVGGQIVRWTDGCFRTGGAQGYARQAPFACAVRNVRGAVLEVLYQSDATHGRLPPMWAATQRAKWLVQRASAAKDRCTNPHNRRFDDYGGRGIEFRFQSPTAMAVWIQTNLGLCQDMQIDRIDNDGHYEPGNLRYATASENQQNTRRQQADSVCGTS